MSYGAFAVREFVGPDVFEAVLTSNPSNWPLHAWLYLPIIPFSLIVSRTSLAIWTTSPLIPLLFPWSSTVPVSAIARGSRAVRFGPFASRPTLWPPPPALVCALFPVVRVLYGRLRNRIIRMMVKDIIPTRAQAARQREGQRGIQEQQLRGNRQERLQQLRMQLRARQRRQQQQQQQQPQQPQPQQQPVGPGVGARIHFQLGELFGFEIAHFVFDRNPPGVGVPLGPGPGPGIARAVAVVDDAANGGDERAEDNAADLQQQPHRDGPVQEPEQDPPALAPADQDPEQQQQQPPPEPEQQQRVEPGQEQEPDPLARDEDDLGAAAARAIRETGASLGRLVGGALLMPSIARIMGSMLLQISHVVPLIRTIIAPLPPPLPPLLPSLSPFGPIGALVNIIRGAPADTVQVGFHGDGHGWLSGGGLGAAVLRGLLGTSQEWATSDPVWYVSFSLCVSQLIHPPMFFTP
jgi:hypothetical protein